MTHRPAVIVVLVWGLMLAMATSVGAATPAAADIESQPLRADHSASPAGRPGQPPAVGQAAGDLWHVVLALGCVIGLALGLRWAARKLALVPPIGGGAGDGRGVRIVSRTVLAPKQQVLLLQVGRRIVVVGDSGAAGMRPLAEITDPDEVAALIGQSKSTPATRGSAKSFGALFRRAAEPFEAAAAPADAPALAPATAELPGEVAGLLDRVRGMRQQFDR